MHPVFKNLNFIDSDENKQVHSYSRSLVAIDLSSALDENENSILNLEPNESTKRSTNNYSNLFEDVLNVDEDDSGDITESDKVQRYIDFKTPKVNAY